MRTFKMHKLAAGLTMAISLAAASPAFASIKDDIASGKPSLEAMKIAVAACDGGAACIELAVQDLIASGVDLNTAIATAVEAGVDAKTVAKAAGTVEGLNAEALTTAFIAAELDPTLVTPATAAGPAVTTSTRSVATPTAASTGGSGGKTVVSKSISGN